MNIYDCLFISADPASVGSDYYGIVIVD
jgi:hypothetical protein